MFYIILYPHIWRLQERSQFLSVISLQCGQDVHVWKASFVPMENVCSSTKTQPASFTSDDQVLSVVLQLHSFWNACVQKAPSPVAVG